MGDLNIYQEGPEIRVSSKLILAELPVLRFLVKEVKRNQPKTCFPEELSS